MKKVLLFVTLLLGSVSFGQTIMVNGSPMLVDDQTSFPFWLESGSSISPETSVSAISVLEFNVKSNDDGNDMVFHQVLSLTSESSVPVGKVWKIESVLKLDLNFNNESDTSSVSDENTDGINSNQSLSGVPVGTILSFAGTSAPEGFLICDGGVISKNDYADLYAVIGDTYGSAEGYFTLEWVDSNNDEIMDPDEMVEIPSYFNIPDLRGRVTVGVDSEGVNLQNAEIGSSGGEETHILTIDEIPSHNHNYQTFGSSTRGMVSNYGSYSNNMTSSASTSFSGGDQPHNNMQPYLVTNYIIKY
jgi:microcystin-dependent protein